MAEATDYLLEAAFGVLEGGRRAYQRQSDVKSQEAITRRKIELEGEEKRKTLREFPRKTPIYDEEGNFLGYAEGQRPLQLREQKQEEDVRKEAFEKEKGKLEAKKTVKGQEEEEFFIKEMTKKFSSSLEKLQEEAESGRDSLVQIKNFQSLLNSKTTGLEGKIRSELAPLMQMIGGKWDTFDDAHKVQLLGRSMIGKMRLELIGPGPVAVYEQELLQRLAGGGKTPLATAKALSNYYKSLSKSKIDRYNTKLNQAINVNKKFGEIYSPIDYRELPSLDRDEQTQVGASGLNSEQRRQRISELRSKQGLP